MGAVAQLDVAAGNDSHAFVASISFENLIVLLSPLITALTVAVSNLSSVPSFRMGAVAATAGMLTLVTNGTRFSTHLTCELLFVAVIRLLYDAITLTPSELSAQLDDTKVCPSAVILMAVSIGMWLGSRPAEDLRLHLKLLTFALMEATILSDNFVRCARVGDNANLQFPCFHWHCPFVASFIVSNIISVSARGFVIGCMHGPDRAQSGRSWGTTVHTSQDIRRTLPAKSARIRFSVTDRRVHARLFRRGVRVARCWWHRMATRWCKSPENPRDGGELQRLLPTSPPPSPPMRLEVLCAIKVISELLNSDDEEVSREVRSLLEQENECTLRSKDEEAALRKLVALADVECWRGFAEEISIDQADCWRAAGCVQLRHDAAVPLRVEEKLGYLSDAYENYTRGLGEFEVVPCGGRFTPASGRAIRFGTPPDELEHCPNAIILDMLDVLEIEAVEDNGVVFGFLPDVHAPVSA